MSLLTELEKLYAFRFEAIEKQLFRLTVDVAELKIEKEEEKKPIRFRVEKAPKKKTRSASAIRSKKTGRRS